MAFKSILKVTHVYSLCKRPESENICSCTGHGEPTFTLKKDVTSWLEVPSCPEKQGDAAAQFQDAL